MERRIRNVMAILLMVAFGVALAGCETADGFGKDLEKLGQKIQDKSN
ncbi:entericidin A/B family lipoprotein [Thalassospira mesophila]|uniref:Entericidin n=1 Tax=Thalassospira mesophila TaxID=1293891 RepID=A0A1Y2L5A4_9PROT|nr:entericidin A/B family lipoprotein [Thalassospira mesophila]OSQ39713.1 entericidin [Thalassospira mesophila]